MIGFAIVVALVGGPETHMIRGIAPLSRWWAVLFFLSLWAWVGLRFIFLWVWAWTVMALAPVCLFVPLRPYVNAPWLMPLIVGVVVACAANVLLVLWWGRRRAHRA